MDTQPEWSMASLDNEQRREFLTSLNTAELLDWYFKTKTVINTQEAAFNEAMRVVNNQKELIEWLIARKMDLESAKSLSAPAGRVTKVVRKTYVITDLEAVMEDVIKNDRLHAFKLSPSKDDVEAIIADLQAQGQEIDCLPGLELRESSSLRFTQNR